MEVRKYSVFGDQQRAGVDLSTGHRKTCSGRREFKGGTRLPGGRKEQEGLLRNSGAYSWYCRANADRVGILMGLEIWVFSLILS